MATYTCTFTDKSTFSWNPQIPSSLSTGDDLILAGPADFSNLRFACSRANGTGGVSSLSCNGTTAKYKPTSATSMSCNLNALFTLSGSEGHPAPDYNINVAALTLDNP